MVIKKDDYFSKLLKKFLPKFLKAIQIDYGIGSNFTLGNAKDEGADTERKPLNLSAKDLSALADTQNRLIKGVNEDLSKRINTLVNENITNRGSNKDLAKSLKTLFDEESPNYFNYKNRFQTIARSESTRVLSVAGFNTAKRLGATKKYLSGVNDSRQGKDSKVAIRKYGTPEQAIDINEPFEYTEGGKFFSYLLPPNRPNDREIVLYVFDEE